MSEDTAAQKVTSIQRCVSQARKVLDEAGEGFRANHIYQDAAVMNVVRACETSIDVANMLIRAKRLGIPTESRDSFMILVRDKLIDAELGKRLMKTIGFRNLAVQRYRELDLDIVEAVIRKSLDDLLAFAQALRPLLSA